MKQNYFRPFKGFILPLLFLAAAQCGKAQRTISGTVTDLKGEPLVGASVVVLGTVVGTATDIDCKYSLQIPAGVHSLTFSYIYFIEQIIALTKDSIYNVKLAVADSSKIELIPIKEFPWIRTKEYTGAVVKVGANDFAQGAINDPIGLLQGKVAGLEVSRPSGDPNGSYTFFIRGISTAAGNPQPLIVIDGIPNADMASVDPADIESVEVLKDGSSAAVYGAQGSNGVLLIVTKKSKGSARAVEYNAQGQR